MRSGAGFVYGFHIGEVKDVWNYMFGLLVAS